MSNTDRDSMLERWADGMERLEQYYEGIYGPPATPPSLPPITTRDAMLEAIADGMERAKRNINKKSTTYHSDSVAYVKTVPAGNVHYASIEQIGGRTLVWIQLMYDPTMTDASNWGNKISPSNFTTSVANNVLTFKRTSSGSNVQIYCKTNSYAPIIGHKYLVSATISADVEIQTARFYVGSSGNAFEIFTTPTQTNAFIECSALTVNTIILQCAGASLAVDNSIYISNFVAYDLTLMFGAGNEPTTVEEFQQQFPAVWYAYNPGTLLSAGVTDVVSKDSNDTTIDTYSIPAEVQALTGYGWSAGSVYNYIDYEAKKFIQNVASVDLSTLTWGYGPSVGWSATLNAKNPADDDTVFNGISATLTPVTRNAQATAFSGGTDAGMVSVSGGKVYVGTGDIGIVPSGTLYYELATPIETDISAYLTDDNLIEVESGGTLTFPNANGDDYRIDVPSSVTFVVGEP